MERAYKKSSHPRSGPKDQKKHKESSHRSTQALHQTNNETDVEYYENRTVRPGLLGSDALLDRGNVSQPSALLSNRDRPLLAENRSNPVNIPVDTTAGGYALPASYGSSGGINQYGSYAGFSSLIQSRPVTTPDSHSSRPLSASTQSSPVYPQQYTPSNRAILEHAFSSHLSELAQEFVRIPLHAYEKCEDFVRDHREIHDEEEDDFLADARLGIKHGDIGYARRCIQQCLLLRKWNLKRSERHRFFEKIIDGDKATLRDFLTDTDRVYAHLKQRADPNAGLSTGTAATFSDAGRPAYVRRLSDAAATQPNMAASQGSLRVLSSDMRNLSILEVAESEPSQKIATRYPTDSGRALVQAHDYGTASSAGNRSQANEADRLVSEQRPTRIRTASIRGNDDQESEPLDSRYKRRNDARTFFTIGRVFALLWHEPVGTPHTGGTHLSRASKQPESELIYSSIRRMVVVKEEHGFCWCIQINTYGGRGMNKSGFSKSDIAAHAIVYMEDSKPKPLSKEPKLEKRPIEVRPSGPDQLLSPASRLNFGRVHTVQHNVKVVNVGKVTGDSQPYLVTYWREQCRD